MEEKKQKENIFLKCVKEAFPYAVIILVIFLIKAYIVAPIMVQGGSMEDTLLEGDVMLLDKMHYRFHEIERFDIVVIDKEDTFIIKRIIGLPGDSVQVQDNVLYINDQKIEEDYLKEGTITNDFSLEEITNSKTIPDGYYFVLGDHREVSGDSRMFGFVQKKEILGKASFTLFPFSRFGKKD